MPRNGSNIYAKPSGTTAVSGETISSSSFNTVVDDLAADQNTPRPVVAGGTGASAAPAARANLNAQEASANLQLLSDLATAGEGGKFLRLSPAEDAIEAEQILEVPAFAGNAGKPVVVNAAEDGVEYGAQSGSRQLIQSGAMADTLTFTSLMDPSLYIGYEIEYIATGQVSIGIAGELVVSSDNGATWDTGSADYSWIMTIPAVGSGGTVADGDDDSILFSSGISWGATAIVHHKISIMRPDLVQLTNITMDLHKTEPGGGNIRFINSGFRDAASAVNAVELRLLAGSGSVTGTYYFYGIRA